MLTVAKSINGPIKILFAGKYIEDDPEGKREYQLLGLGDIVMPGIFISMALRFDIVRKIAVDWTKVQSDKKEAAIVYEKIIENINTNSKPYFWACLVGYLIAIVVTVVVMLVFEHGQPALLYLVPGVCLSVILTSLAKGEFNAMWTHDENKFIGGNSEEEEKAFKAAEEAAEK
jgi:minor histocompatibility antigen H13